MKTSLLLPIIFLFILGCKKENDTIYSGYIKLKSPGQADNYVTGQILNGALAQGVLFNYHDTVTNYTGTWRVTNRYLILTTGFYYGSERGYAVKGTAAKGDSTAIVLRIFAESDITNVQ